MRLGLFTRGMHKGGGIYLRQSHVTQKTKSFLVVRRRYCSIQQLVFILKKNILQQLQLRLLSADVANREGAVTR